MTGYTVPATTATIWNIDRTELLPQYAFRPEYNVWQIMQDITTEAAAMVAGDKRFTGRIAAAERACYYITRAWIIRNRQGHNPETLWVTVMQAAAYLNVAQSHPGA